MNSSRFPLVLLALTVAFSQFSCSDSDSAAPAEPPANNEAKAVPESAASTAVKSIENDTQAAVDEHAGHGHSANEAGAAHAAKAAAASGSSQYFVDEHYELLGKPKKMVGPDKIEVMEVFWYGCSHCYTFEPLIHKWLDTIADDVAFARTPATGHPTMRMHANVYYAAEALKLPQEIHSDIFALLAKNNRMEDQKKFAAIFAKYEVEEETYLNTFNSFAVKGKVSQAGNRDKKHYQVGGTPTLIVNGKYRVSGRKAGGQAGMLAVTNHLIELERDTQPQPES